MALPPMSDYEFKDFTSDLVRTQTKHHHTIGREPNVTYADEFAKRELLYIDRELYEQSIQGWSRSYYNTERHMEAIRAYGIPNRSRSELNEDLYKDGFDATITGLCSLPRVKALSVLSDLDKVPFKSSTAAGYDYSGAKGLPNSENYNRAVSRAKAIMWSIKEDRHAGMTHAISTSTPDVGYTRTQLTDLTEKTKVRNVWGRAFHYILLEGLFAAPLIAHFSKHQTFYHIGRDPLISVPEALNHCTREAKWLYALDWRQFDATVNRYEIDAAFDILEHLLDFPDQETYVVFLLCWQLFIHKKIAAPDGYVYWAHKGIPSGSYFTSIVGSIINKLRVEYLWRAITGHGPKVCYVQGDDSLCADNDFVPPEAFASIANPIGWSLNVEKTEYSTIPMNVSFLGRTMSGGFNRRSVIKCLRLLIFPEVPVIEGKISAFRAASINQDCGLMSEVISKIASKLKRRYGIASEDEVPSQFKRYIM